jgi:hypothetical protein
MLPYNSPDIWYDYVTLYWREPCKPNGIITGYIVSYNITTSTANVHCPVEEHYMAFNVTGNVTFHKNIRSAKINETLITAPNIRTIVR